MKFKQNIDIQNQVPIFGLPVTRNSKWEFETEDGRYSLEYLLSQNYPNPFNSLTIILFGVPDESKVTLLIYDLLGRKVRTLVNGNLNPDFIKLSGMVLTHLENKLQRACISQ
jgi:hypothetical protein